MNARLKLMPMRRVTLRKGSFQISGHKMRQKFQGERGVMLTCFLVIAFIASPIFEEEKKAQNLGLLDFFHKPLQTKRFLESFEISVVFRRRKRKERRSLNSVINPLAAYILDHVVSSGQYKFQG